METLKRDAERAARKAMDKIPNEVHLDSFTFAPFYPLLGIYKIITNKQVIGSMLSTLLLCIGVSAIYFFCTFPIILFFIRSPWLSWMIPFKTYAFIIDKTVGNVASLFGLSFLVNRLRSLDIQWWLALIVTLIQAGFATNVVVGWRIRSESQRIAEKVLKAERARYGLQDSTIVHTENELEKREKGEVKREVEKSGIAWWIIATVFKLVLFPIYSIPVVGQIVYLYRRAPDIALDHTSRLSRVASQKLKAEHYWALSGFGMVAGLLESLVIFNAFFRMSNSCGAAIWISHVEKLEKERSEENKKLN